MPSENTLLCPKGSVPSSLCFLLSFLVSTIARKELITQSTMNDPSRIQEIFYRQLLEVAEVLVNSTGEPDNTGDSTNTTTTWFGNVTYRVPSNANEHLRDPPDLALTRAPALLDTATDQRTRGNNNSNADHVAVEAWMVGIGAVVVAVVFVGVLWSWEKTCARNSATREELQQLIYASKMDLRGITNSRTSGGGDAASFAGGRPGYGALGDSNELLIAYQAEGFEILDTDNSSRDGALHRTSSERLDGEKL
mmetsp:Transcript_47419/g.90548  ORF Transcript_47419/g.90548 Transcript_47419/m.90548 type:complete len:251 (-) Transcript_47419:289-1041(-)|eukprot:CAMPEP_0114255120 /NCGR_PEP_ID=MMETSP0058-20121206/17379_1 /TAXON_ID=36894 /ORGANISM="Pyramimonas parkeae, CCMP726" /LENGTH=250 /DNA_ID=CAMNT_0001369457 /DNA_START=132 /DNA_END=884 /DNA_ORIENTATION=-